MSATTDEALAQEQRRMQEDPKAMEAVLRARVIELTRYHGHLLPLAREVVEELFVLNLAMFQHGDSLDGFDVLGAVAMTLGDMKLPITWRERIAKVRKTLAAEAARQRLVYPDGIGKSESQPHPQGAA